MMERFGLKWRSYRYVENEEHHIITLDLMNWDSFPNLDELRLWLHQEIANDDAYIVATHEGRVFIAISHDYTTVAATFKIMFLE